MTLTELMLGLSLLGLMGSVGLAQGSQVLLDQRLESATRLVDPGLQRARREAQRRGAPCGLRLSPTGWTCLLYTSPSPRDRTRSRMPSSA